MAKKDWLNAGADGLTFGERLEDLIKLRETTATAVAQATGIAQSGMSSYINHHSAPDSATIYTLAKYFSVSSDYLLGLSDVSTPNLTVQEIHRMTGLTEENVTSLVNCGPFGQQKIPYMIQGYKQLTNDLICYASTHHAARTYSCFLKEARNPEPPHPRPLADDDPTIVEIKVVAEIKSGIPEEGVNYAEGFTAVPSNKYSRILLDDFLHDLKVYLRNLYFDADIGEMDDGND